MSVRHRFRTPAVAVLAAMLVIAAGCSDKGTDTERRHGAGVVQPGVHRCAAEVHVDRHAQRCAVVSEPHHRGAARSGCGTARGEQRVRARPSHSGHDL